MSDDGARAQSLRKCRPRCLVCCFLRVAPAPVRPRGAGVPARRRLCVYNDACDKPWGPVGTNSIRKLKTEATSSLSRFLDSFGKSQFLLSVSAVALCGVLAGLELRNPILQKLTTELHHRRDLGVTHRTLQDARHKERGTRYELGLVYRVGLGGCLVCFFLFATRAGGAGTIPPPPIRDTRVGHVRFPLRSTPFNQVSREPKTTKRTKRRSKRTPKTFRGNK